MFSFGTRIHITIFCLLAATAGVAGDTLYVPAQYTTIQAAINAASDGDHILVASGTYTGSGSSVIDTLGKALWIDADNEIWELPPVIDGQDVRTGVICGSGENNDTIIYGFQIIRGYGEYGGAVRCSGSSPTFKYCTFQNNVASEGGGGVCNVSATPAFEYCSFRVNSSIDGAGMANYNGAAPTLVNCSFIENTSEDDGGGMYSYFSNPTLSGCLFSGNTAENNGGGMYGTHSIPTLMHCSFHGNYAQYAGGGFYNGGSIADLTNCTFAENSAERGGGMDDSSSDSSLIDCHFEFNHAYLSEEHALYYGEGGGLFGSRSNSTLENCTFIANIADTIGGGMCFKKGSEPSFSNCTIKSNSAEYGGGLYAKSCSLMVIDCDFRSNFAEEVGGAICSYDEGTSWFINCSITGNQSAWETGGVYFSGNDPRSGPQVVSMTDCLVSENEAEIGGGVRTSGFDDYGNVLQLTDTKVCANEPAQIVGTWSDSGGNTVQSVCWSLWLGDLDNDGFVNGSDLARLLGAWGQNVANADLDSDGVVGGSDLAILLGAWR